MTTCAAEPPTKKQRLNNEEIQENDELSRVMRDLNILSQKSNLQLHSEAEDGLNVIVLYNCDDVIPIKSDIISGIQLSKCALCAYPDLVQLLSDFIVTAHGDTHFSTAQFLELLSNPQNIDCIIDNDEDIADQLRSFYLSERMKKEIDEKRTQLSVSNIRQLSGFVSEDEQDDDEDPVVFNWDFVQYLNENLCDASIITVPTDTFTLQNAGETQAMDAAWEFIHDHFIVARTRKGDIVGYRSKIVWT
mmetsp:Transcript_9819/g.14951  ORF Transcript_9819/g.14951 Transcript_9819/m.14951 type:complete len:247 (-) Transcript_9819:10-750(-)